MRIALLLLALVMAAAGGHAARPLSATGRSLLASPNDDLTSLMTKVCNQWAADLSTRNQYPYKCLSLDMDGSNPAAERTRYPWTEWPLVTVEGSYGEAKTLVSGYPPASVIGDSYECRNSAGAAGAQCNHDLTFSMTEESSWSTESSLHVGAGLSFKIPLTGISTSLSIDYTVGQKQGRSQGKTVTYSDKCDVPAPTAGGCVNCQLVVGISHSDLLIPVKLAMTGSVLFIMETQGFKVIVPASVGYAVKRALDNNLIPESQRPAWSFDNAGNRTESAAFWSTNLRANNAVAVRSSKDYAKCEGVAAPTAAALVGSHTAAALPPSTPVKPTISGEPLPTQAKPAMPIGQWAQHRAQQLEAIVAKLDAGTLHRNITLPHAVEQLSG